jgi:hypothetical protein
MFKNFHRLFVNAVGTILNVGVEFGFSDRVGSASKRFSYLDFFPAYVFANCLPTRFNATYIKKRKKNLYKHISKSRKINGCCPPHIRNHGTCLRCIAGYCLTLLDNYPYYHTLERATSPSR